MKKNKDLKLLRKSIKHWCLDIRRPLLKGDEVLGNLKWKIDGGDVEMFSDSCALCQEYSPTCTPCPLCRTNNACNIRNSMYLKFYNNANIESANNMIAALLNAYMVTMSEEGG